MILPRPVIVANEIRMLRSYHRGTFLLVEGRDDRLVFERHTSKPHCHVKVLEGKERLYEVVQILEEARFPGVVGVVDADLDRIQSIGVPSPNILMTDDHDLETMQLRSPALDVLLGELGSPTKLQRFGADVRQALLTAALPIGALRLHSRRAAINLRFDGLRYGNCIDPSNLLPDPDAIVREVINRSMRQDLDAKELKGAVELVLREGHDPWQLCSGPDLVAVLSLGLRKTLGTNDAAEVTEDRLQRMLRIAYGGHLHNSGLRAQLEAWVQQHPPYRVF